MNMVVTFVFGCCIGLVLGAGLILWATCMDRKRGGNDQPRSLGRNGSTVEGRGGIDMDDTIRRTDAIEAFNGAELGTYTDPDKAAQEIIGTVPSAEPKTGEWIDVNGDGSLWRCSRCEDTVCCNGNYCPTCGAKMKGGDTE